MDKHTPEQRKKNMQAVKAEGSKIEKTLAKSLWANSYRYRKNYAKVTGKPDLAFPGKKIAIFADSEFWHGKDWSTQKSTVKSNRDFWIPKIERNIERDKEVNKILKEKGWRVLRFWGQDILADTESCVREIEKELNK